MKKLLVFALGHLSHGELTIALETLRQLHGKSFELLFLSHPNGVRYIESIGIPAKSLNHPEPKENRKEVEQLLNAWKPDILLCADVYTLEFSVSWSGIDFAYVRNLSIPLGSMDQYEWESTPFAWDYFSKTPVQVEENLIKDCDFLIRPCPLNKPYNNNNTRICTCPLFSVPVSHSKRTRSEWCQELGLPEDQKVIFTVNSGWEYVSMSRLPRVRNFMKWMPKILHEYFAGISMPLTIVHVGPQEWEFALHENIRYQYFSHMPASLYRDTIYHADLFCTTNATSITLSMAVYLQTPSILFQNYKRMDFDALSSILPQMPQWYQNMAEEVKIAEVFRMFPWGWYYFLDPVLKGNSYTESFITVPVLIPQKAMKNIKKYLTAEESIQKLKEAQYKYFKKVEELNSVGSFLLQLIS